MLIASSVNTLKWYERGGENKASECKLITSNSRYSYVFFASSHFC